MKQIILLESNQNHATITSNGICTTLPASMVFGVGYVPMVVVTVHETVDRHDSRPSNYEN